MPKKFIAVIEISDSEDEVLVVPHTAPEPILIELSDDDDETEKQSQVQNQQQEQNVSDDEEIEKQTQVQNQQQQQNVSDDEEIGKQTQVQNHQKQQNVSDSDEAYETEAAYSEVDRRQLEVTAASDNNSLNNNSEKYSNEENANGIPGLPPNIIACPDDLPAVTPVSNPVNDSQSITENRNELIKDVDNCQSNSSIDIVSTPSPRNSVVLEELPGNVFVSGRSNSSPMSNCDSPVLPMIRISSSIFDTNELEKSTEEDTTTSKEKSDIGTSAMREGEGNDAYGRLDQGVEQNKNNEPHAVTINCETPMVKKPKAKRKRPNPAGTSRTDLAIQNLMNVMGIGSSTDDSNVAGKQTSPPSSRSPTKAARKRRRKDVLVPRTFCLTIDDCFSIAKPGAAAADPPLTLDLLMKPPEVASLRVPRKRNRKQTVPKVSAVPIAESISQTSESPPLSSNQIIDNDSNLMELSPNNRHQSIEDSTLTPEAQLKGTTKDEDATDSVQSELVQISISKEATIPEQIAEHHISATGCEISNLDQQVTVTTEATINAAPTDLLEESHESGKEQAGKHSVSDDIQLATEVHTSLKLDKLHQSNLVHATSTNVCNSAVNSSSFPVDSASQDNQVSKVSKPESVVRVDALEDENEMLLAPRPANPDLITLNDNDNKVIEPILQNSNSLGFPSRSAPRDSKLTLNLLSSEWDLLFPNSNGQTVRIDEAYQGILSLLSDTFHVRISISEKYLTITFEGADRKRRTLARHNMLYWLECQAGGIDYTLQYIKPKQSRKKKQGNKGPKLQANHKSKNPERMRHSKRMQSNGHSSQTQGIRNGSVNNQFNSFGSYLPGPCYPNPTFPLYPHTQQIPHSQFSQHQNNRNEFWFNPQQLGPPQANFNNNQESDSQPGSSQRWGERNCLGQNAYQEETRRQEVSAVHSAYRYYHPYRRFNSSQIRNHDGNIARSYDSNLPRYPTYRMSL